MPRVDPQEGRLAAFFRSEDTQGDVREEPPQGIVKGGLILGSPLPFALLPLLNLKGYPMDPTRGAIRGWSPIGIEIPSGQLEGGS